MITFVKTPAHRERGAILLPLSIFISIVIASLFVLASHQLDNLYRRYWISEATRTTQDIASALAERLRWAYDTAAASVTNPSLCDPMAGWYATSISSMPPIKLCLSGGQVCVPHPKDAHPICVGPSYGTLTAKVSNRTRPVTIVADRASARSQNAIATWFRLTLPRARAASFSPPAPPAIETSNDLNPLNPATCIAGDCGGAQCGINADCVSFQFCPLTSSCNPDELVWQTVAFLK